MDNNNIDSINLLDLFAAASVELDGAEPCELCDSLTHNGMVKTPIGKAVACDSCLDEIAEDVAALG